MLEKLVESAENSLADWFAEPLPVARARTSLVALGRRTGAGSGGPGRAFGVRLAEMVCRYWAGLDTEADYRNLSALYRRPRQRAVLELVSGQLLIACRLQGAWGHLDRGFSLAARLLAAEDYFVVLRRHELLRQLPLFPSPARPATLEDLLSEARIIARLRGNEPIPLRPQTGHRDTVD
jgi:hypothetical protein